MASKLNLVVRLQHWMDSVPGQTFLNYAYSWGASVVILGALFKLTHLPGGNLMLFLGMGTEAFVFFLAAFDRPFDKNSIDKELADDFETDEEIERSEAIAAAKHGVGGGTVIIGGTPVVGSGVAAAVAQGAAPAATQTSEGVTTEVIDNEAPAAEESVIDASVVVGSAAAGTPAAGGVVAGAPVVGGVVAGAPVVGGAVAGAPAAGGAPVVGGVAAAGTAAMPGADAVAAAAAVLGAAAATVPAVEGAETPAAPAAEIAEGAEIAEAAEIAEGAETPATEKPENPLQTAVSEMYGTTEGTAFVEQEAQKLAEIIRLANDELLRRAQAVLSPEMEAATEEYIEKLHTLNETLAKVDEQSARLTRDSQEMENLNRTLIGINKVYDLHFASISRQVTTIEDINRQTSQLAAKIEEVNSIYARMMMQLGVMVNPTGAAPMQAQPTAPMQAQTAAPVYGAQPLTAPVQTAAPAYAQQPAAPAQQPAAPAQQPAAPAPQPAAPAQQPAAPAQQPAQAPAYDPSIYAAPKQPANPYAPAPTQPGGTAE